MPASVAACWPKLRLSQTGAHPVVGRGERPDGVVGAVRAAVVHQHHLGDAVGAPGGGHPVRDRRPQLLDDRAERRSPW